MRFGFNFGFQAGGGGGGTPPSGGCCDFFGDGSQIFGACFEDNFEESCGNYTISEGADDTNYNYVDGPVNRAVDFYNNDWTYFVLDTLIENPESVSIWVMSHDAATSQYNMNFIGGEGTGNRSALRLKSNHCRVIDVGDHIICDPAVSWNNDEWHHVVFNRNREMWIDGVKVVNAGAVFDFKINHIGAWKYDASYNCYGGVDEIKFFNRYLTDSEVQQLYAEGSP